MRTFVAAGLLISVPALAGGTVHAQGSGSIQATVQVIDFSLSTRTIDAARQLRPTGRRASHGQARRDLPGMTIVLDRPPRATDTHAGRRVTISHW